VKSDDTIKVAVVENPFRNRLDSSKTSGAIMLDGAKLPPGWRKDKDGDDEWFVDPQGNSHWDLPVEASSSIAPFKLGPKVGKPPLDRENSNPPRVANNYLTSLAVGSKEKRSESTDKSSKDMEGLPPGWRKDKDGDDEWFVDPQGNSHWELREIMQESLIMRSVNEPGVQYLSEEMHRLDQDNGMPELESELQLDQELSNEDQKHYVVNENETLVHATPEVHEQSQEIGFRSTLPAQEHPFFEDRDHKLDQDNGTEDVNENESLVHETPEVHEQSQEIGFRSTLPELEQLIPEGLDVVVYSEVVSESPIVK